MCFHDDYGPNVSPHDSAYPFALQLLSNDFVLDSISVDPKITTFVSGVDYMTDFDSWLHIQVYSS